MSAGIYGAGVYGISVYGTPTTPGVVTILPSTVLVDTLSPLALPAPGDFAIDQYGEFVLTATGDLGMVTGAARLVQDVWMLAVTPRGGALCDPTYGDALAGLVGTRMPSPAQVQAAASGLASATSTLHATRTAQGDAPGPEEGIASVGATVFASGNALTLDLTVTTRSGAAPGLSIPLAGTG